MFKSGLITIFFAFFIISCEETTGPNDNGIFDTWSKTVGFGEDSTITLLTLKKDFNFEVNVFVSEGKKDNIYGTFLLQNDTITFTDEECDDLIGKYKYKINESEIYFNLILDSCSRSETIKGLWDRQ